MTDWRLPEDRREAFRRFYAFHLKYRTHPGLVYIWLPAIAEAYDLDADGRAWLAWLNGNTQNPVTSLLLLEAAPRPQDWRKAVDFWNDNFTQLEWDTDRRHQKSKFGEATERWATGSLWPALGWEQAGLIGWPRTWDHAFRQPYMGRLSSWSMIEFARILLGHDVVPDSDDLMLSDPNGSRSHRNGLALVAGHDSVYWGPEAAKYVDNQGGEDIWLVDDLQILADQLVAEQDHPDAGYLTLESALCTYKGWHKPNRRYPNCYADMAYGRLLKAEDRFGRRFQLLWDARAAALPDHLLLERQLDDPGLVPAKQNWYLETGQPIMMDHDYPDMPSGFPRSLRKDAARWS